MEFYLDRYKGREKITYECEVVTPMFLGGADPKSAELRSASLKGALRFWWRALYGSDNLTEMKKREDEIFGSTDKKSSFDVWIEFDNNSNNINNSNNSNNSNNNNEKDTSNISNEINKYAGIKYLFYSMTKSGGRKFIEAGKNFDIIVVGNNEVLSQVHASLYTLSIFGGLGSRTRRGAGAFEVLNINYDKKDGNNIFNIDFKNKDKIKENLLICRSLVCKDKKNNNWASSYTNFSLARWIISNNNFNDWKKCLNDIGNTFKKFRDSKKSDVFKTPAFGFPIQHKKNGTFIGKINNEKILRRASPLFISVIKDNEFKYRWIILRMAGELLKYNGKIIREIKKKDSNNQNNSNYQKISEKPDFSLLDEFWNEIRNNNKEILLSNGDLDKKIEEIKKKINPDKIILFGSKARGDFKKNSDIDLAIVKNGVYSTLDINGNIDIIDYNKANQEFKRKIDTEGVIIYER